MEKETAKEEDNTKAGKPVIKNDKKQEKNPLEKYTIDLTAIAAQSKLDPVIGRDDEIRRVIQILNRRSKK